MQKPIALFRIDDSHLSPHLRDVCAVLARGILRLRSRNGEELNEPDRHAAETRDGSLHSTAKQRRHANPRKGEHA